MKFWHAENRMEPVTTQLSSDELIKVKEQWNISSPNK
jgi:hypothetical protein